MTISIRNFIADDAPKLRQLMHNTIRQYCIKDYSVEQVIAWSPEHYDQGQWLTRLGKVNPYVAIKKREIVGFADLQKDGYIDLFYCGYNTIGTGVGGALMRYIFSVAQQQKITRLYSHVSITAKPFFEHFGFQVVKSQQVSVRGAVLTNYVMECSLLSNQ